MRTKMIAGLTIAAVLAAGGVAIASDHGGWRKHSGERMRDMGRKMFEQADTDKDGAVSAAEFGARLEENHLAADRNGDGAVDRAEFVAAIEARVENDRVKRRAGRIADRMLVRFDLDEDGKVTRAEFENRAKKHFALADWNDDGKVEPAELRRVARHGGMGRHGGMERRQD